MIPRNQFHERKQSAAWTKEDTRCGAYAELTGSRDSDKQQTTNSEHYVAMLVKPELDLPKGEDICAPDFTNCSQQVQNMLNKLHKLAFDFDQLSTLD